MGDSSGIFLKSLKNVTLYHFCITGVKGFSTSLEYVGVRCSVVSVRGEGMGRYEPR